MCAGKYISRISEDYRNLLDSYIHSVKIIINRIILNDTGLDTGIEELSRLFSDFAVSVFGKGPDIAANHNKRNRKLNSPWFNFECETARRELRFASRAHLLISKRHLT